MRIKAILGMLAVVGILAGVGSAAGQGRNRGRGPVANKVSCKRFSNRALVLGQIGVDMAPCDGDCSFCFFAKSHTPIQASVLPTDEIIARCHRFAEGGVHGVFLMTMHRFGFEWFRDLCATLRKSIGFSELTDTYGRPGKSLYKNGRPL